MINFKRILAVAATALMLGSTAAAANYPAPFVEGGTAEGAVVVGANAASSDWAAAIDLSQDLETGVTSTSGTTDASITGEAYPLFTDSSKGKVYINDTIGAIRPSLTDTELPTILADGQFEGDESADYTQIITVNDTAKVKYAKQPSTSDDPVIGIELGTGQANAVYMTTVTFDKAVNFTHTDSHKQDLTLFGQKFTVGTATTNAKGIVLYKSSETVELSIGGTDPNPSQTVTIGGEEYIVELTAATSTSATVKVTDSSGASDSKEIDEGDSKKIQGVEVATNLAHSSTATDTESAEITVGAEKVVLKNGNKVKIGSDEDSVEGTKVMTSNTAIASDITTLEIVVWENEGKEDAIVQGGAFVDPVFGTFKVDFAGLNIPDDSDTREEIVVQANGNDKMQITFTNHQGNEVTMDWYNNESTAALQDADQKDINVMEMAEVNESEYVILGNEDEAYLLQLTAVENDSDTYTESVITFTDVFDTSKTYSATIGDGDTAYAAAKPAKMMDGQGANHDGYGTAYVYVGGKKYSIYYTDSDTDGDEFVRIKYPTSESDNAKTMVLYPVIETAKGAKVMFYKPYTDLNLTCWDGIMGDSTNGDALANNLTTISIPDGKDYTDITLGCHAAGTSSTKTFDTMSTCDVINVTVGSTTNTVNTSQGEQADSAEAAIGEMVFNLTTATNVATINGSIDIYMIDPDGKGNLDRPAIVILTEEDDNDKYEAIVIESSDDKAGSSNYPVGVGDVQMTWISGDNGATTELADFYQSETDDDLYSYMDLWGTLVTVDESDTDSYSVTVSYPDDQVYAQIYVAEDTAAIDAAVATSGGGGDVLVVKDSEASSVSGKNLVVVGGSCINTVAATMLDSDTPLCGSAFTDKTGAGAGQYLIKVAASPLNADKIAMLVAGYDAADTTDAAAKAQEGVATDVDTEQVYPIATA